MSFTPNPANVQVGQEIRWVNEDSLPHTATSSGGIAFDTGTIAGGATSGPIVLRSSGVVSYFCNFHPSMVGTLNVTP